MVEFSPFPSMLALRFVSEPDEGCMVHVVSLSGACFLVSALPWEPREAVEGEQLFGKRAGEAVGAEAERLQRGDAADRARYKRRSAMTREASALQVNPARPVSGADRAGG